MKKIEQYISEHIIKGHLKKQQKLLTVGEIINNYFRQTLPASYLNHPDVKKYDNLLDVKRSTLKHLFDYTPLRFIYLRNSKYIVPVCTWTECYRIFQQEKNNEPSILEQEYDKYTNEFKTTLVINGINRKLILRTKEAIK